MPELPAVVLRARTDDDLDVLFSIAADLDTWEERNLRAPAPLTRAQYEARLARRPDADADADDDAVSFVVDADGAAVGSAMLFDFDSLARHAEAGISLLAGARGRGIGTAAIGQLVDFGFARRNLHRIHLQAIASNVGAIRAYEKAGFVVEGRPTSARLGTRRVRGHRADGDPALGAQHPVARRPELVPAPERRTVQLGDDEGRWGIDLEERRLADRGPGVPQRLAGG